MEEKTFKANFNPASSDFDEIVKTNCFIDKTLLIRTIFDKSATAILINAPHRYGKSTNMDMVKKFVEIQVDENGLFIDRESSPNRRIFEDNNLLVFQDKKFFDERFATYPVIHATFKPVSGNTFEKILDKFRYVMHKTFELHKYLLKSDKLDSEEKEVFRTYYGEKSFRNLTETDIETGLEFLSKCLYNHFHKKKVFLLIDEYDAPINKTMFEESIAIKVNKLLSEIFSNTLKENKYVGRSLLTGISYFATVGLSGLNNIQKYIFQSDHDFVPYYGFTEDEVSKLLTDFKITSENAEEIYSHCYEYMNLNGIKMFPILSILNYLHSEVIENYWEQPCFMDHSERIINYYYC